jgi:hypothetical protein
LLRQAGILSGVVLGFLPDGKKVTTQHAHGCSFALLPTKHNAPQMVLLDGTPHGVVPSLASLSERAQQQTHQQQALGAKSLQALDTINDLINQYPNDPKAITDAIQTLYNGNLEDTMNAILHTTITAEKYQRILNMLNAYRYTPLKNSKNLGDLKAFLTQAINTDTATHILPSTAGSQLFDAVNAFVDRFAKEQLDKAKQTNKTKKREKKLAAFERLDFLITASQDILDSHEYLALAIIAKYLKAEKVFKRTLNNS